MRIGGEATLFLSTPSARRATPQQQTLRGESNISIHALREEGDNSKQARRAAISISIHALREEGDQTSQVKKLHRHDFYPRPPRGGRHSQPTNGSTNRPISIHALREEGDLLQRQGRLFQRVISIHALREEGDGFLLC